MRSLVAIFVIVVLPSSVYGRMGRTQRHVTSDPAYSSALQTADNFLHAWQTQNHEAGIMMLSDHARQFLSPEQMQQFFSPEANAAYEIEHGRRRKSGAYAFPVVLRGKLRAPRTFRRNCDCAKRQERLGSRAVAVSCREKFPQRLKPRDLSAFTALKSCPSRSWFGNRPQNPKDGAS